MSRLSNNFPRRLVWTVCLIGLSALACAVVCLGEERPGENPQPNLFPSPPPQTEAGSPLYPTWWGPAPEAAAGVTCKEPGTCVTCHEENSTMDASHAIACVRCHNGDSSAEDREKAHQGLIADPGDLRTVDQTCGSCHPEETRRVRRSAMALAPRIINHTRFAFGAQKDPDPVHATVNTEDLKQVPSPAGSSKSVDDLLRRSCLRCHLNARGSRRWGEHRGAGCSACHVPYPNDDGHKGAPHRLVRSVGMTACLKCHNSNHVGADYVGLFEKDFNRGFVSPFVDGKQPPHIYGAEQHRLAADVHFRLGMDCMDCHILDEIHGTGDPPRSAHPGVKISCEGCHVRGDHPAVLKDDQGQLTLLRGEGRKIPPWNPNSIPHSVENHRNKVRCSACHAAWSFQDYGFHLMLEERADYWKWAPNAAQNDPQVQELLLRNVGTYVELVPPRSGSVPPRPQEDWTPPETQDWLTGETRPGAWFRGFTARRWSTPPLGIDAQGRVSIMRPMRQYVISHVDSEDTILLDRVIPTTGKGDPALVFNPYEPHTTSAIGRACQECHGNPKALGLGDGMSGIEKPGFYPLWRTEVQIPGHSFRWDALVTREGEPVQKSTRPGAGPLDADTLRRLLHPSKKHRALWHKYLKQMQSGP